MPTRLGKRGLVILDRDGVINRDSASYIKSAREWLPLPGSVDAIASLSKAGFTVAIASNQSGLARGYFDRNALRGMHAKMRRHVRAAGGKISRIVVCPHAPDAGCACRKPKPEMLHRLARFYGANIHDVTFVGDSYKDVQAAIAAGARPALVRTGNGAQTEALHRAELAGVAVFDDLAAAATYLRSH